MKSTLTLSLLLFLALSVTVTAQSLDETILKAAQQPLLSMPEPPLGYSVAKQPLVAGEALLGFQVLVAQEEAVSKVLIKTIFDNRPDQGSRVAACKGYVNGFADGLKEAGFKITASKFPDIDKSDFKTPVVVDLTFQNAEGTELLVKKLIFFTDKGFDVTVIATDKDDLSMLAAWAAQIRPATSKASR